MQKRLWLLGILILLIGTILTVWWIFRPQAPSSEQKPISTSTPPPVAKPSYVDQKLQAMSLRDKVASLFIFHRSGVDQAALHSYMTTYKPGGFIFMGDNIPNTTEQLQKITADMITDPALPPLLAVDEEGDTVRRLATDTFPGALTLPDLPPAATKDAFQRRSDLVKSVGLNLNFGIIADVTDNPTSFIFPRVLGTTPNQAAERVAQAVASSKGRTLSTIKHFPGHGETGADSHTSIPATQITYDEWSRKDMIPFKAGIDAGVDLVMFGHLRYSAVDGAPASLSKKWHDVLRSTLGFKGLTITDDMIMLQNSGDPAYANAVDNAVAAINAGNDLLLFVLDHGDSASQIDPNTLVDGVVNAVQAGKISESIVDEHARSILGVRHSLTAQDN
ncbi:MAG TPA: glycoside hydrolase family 3 N-terminal domain-containing protein [Candidatus Saccharimonadales bacterium]|nr:glycoside hydrolase family 3 N-terminal domain-containing protein [Candidatus Saccharimonadales bacterium]